MSNAKKFEELLRSDEALQAKLRDAFDGDKADERAVFDAVVVPLAAEAGLPFSSDERKSLAELAREGAELSDEELEAVAGGGWSDSDGPNCPIGPGI